MSDMSDTLVQPVISVLPVCGVDLACFLRFFLVHGSGGYGWKADVFPFAIAQIIT